MYKIIRITDKNNVDKINDKDAMNRVGRVIDDIQSNLAVGSNGFLYCTYPDFLKSMITSKIERVSSNDDQLLIYTQNSIYYLKRVGKAIIEEK